MAVGTEQELGRLSLVVVQGVQEQRGTIRPHGRLSILLPGSLPCLALSINVVEWSNKSTAGLTQRYLCIRRDAAYSQEVRPTPGLECSLYEY
jgi:hypothetical protein